MKERKRLEVLMFIFVLSYVGTSAYFIADVMRKLDCTGTDECKPFIDLMWMCGIFLVCDVVPMAELYR